MIKGEFGIGKIVERPFFSSGFYSWEDSLTGTIFDGMADVTIKGKYEGNATLIFKGNGEIDATIKVMGDGIYADKFLNGNYSFVPYNLADLQNHIKTDSFAVDLDSWRNVNLVTLVSDGNNKSSPSAYLTNECDDILYHFLAPFQSGTKIIDVAVEDMNGDGLKDVTVTLAPFDFTTGSVETEASRIECGILQTDNGLFYVNYLMYEGERYTWLELKKSVD